MGIIGNLKDKAYQFLWTVALKKGSKQLVKVALSWIATIPLASYGVSISIEEATAVATLTAVLEIGRNWLKHKVGVKGI